MTLSPLRTQALEWLLAHLDVPGEVPGDLLSASWRNPHLARFAVGMALDLAQGCAPGPVESRGEASLRCPLQDSHGNERELLVDFDASGRIAKIAVRPVLDDDIEVRVPGPDDVAEMRRLELAAPVRRDDGTEITIDHAGRQFDHVHVVRDHRWLAAFRSGRMLAVQGVAISDARLAGQELRLAYNHYSRSDPEVRRGGCLIHLVSTLYREIYPSIDQFVSAVDIRNAAGLRLSFGRPWPARLLRLFLPVASLVQRPGFTTATGPYDADRTADILNATHEGLNLWKPRTGAFLRERDRRAPLVYGPGTWRVSGDAALAVWPSCERRTYRRDGAEISRTLALVLDYGFRGEAGRREFEDLLADAARDAAGRGVTHLAIFVAEGNSATAWLEAAAESADVYAVCAPDLPNPAAPVGPTYMDHVLF